MREEKSEFLGLTAAASFLGVHPATLRRWADQGDVLCVVTPGGHRRFPQTEIESLLRRRRDSTGKAGEDLIDTLLQSTPDQIARMDNISWMSELSEAQRTHLRDEGRHVMGLLRRYLSSNRDREDVLANVKTAGADYAESAAAAKMSLTDLLSAVAFFRSHILETAVDQKTGTALDRRTLFRDVNVFLNTLLLSVAETFEAINLRTS